MKNARELMVGSKECSVRAIHMQLCRNPALTENWSEMARGLDISGARILKFRRDLLLDKITTPHVIYEMLEIWVGAGGSEATLGKFLEVLMEGEYEGGGAVVESIRLHFNLPCKEAEDDPSVEWKDLSPAFQNKVSDNLRNAYPKCDFPPLILGQMKGDLLVNLMTGKHVNLSGFKKTLPERLSYYVPRTVLTRNIISKGIFEQNSLTPDIFLFTGMDRIELSSLAKDRLTSGSREQLRGNEEVTVQFIILEHAAHFEKICGRTTHPVHLLRMEGNRRLRWVRSLRGMHNLQKYVDPEQDELAEEEFCKISNSRNISVCISDSPGMGKSVLLSQIGNRLNQMRPDVTVAFIVMSEFIKLVKQLELVGKAEGIAEALKGTICENVVGEVVLQSMLDSPSPSENDQILIELLLDGFDEVDSADFQLAHELLKSIQISFKSIRIWVTSRPHYLRELEDNLNILGYNIQAFQEDNQIQFLSSFWTRAGKLDQQRTQEFAERCIKSLKSKMNSTIQDIAGIPLQCLLIAEAYEDDVLEYAGLVDDNYSEIGIEAQIQSITNLYRLLIQRKLSKYKSTYGQIKQNENRLMDLHVAYGVVLLCPEYSGKLGLPEPTANDLEEVLKVGILEMSFGAPRFMHRTIAEYFLAWHVAESLRREPQPVPFLPNWFLRRNKWNGEMTNFFLRYVLECEVDFEEEDEVNPYHFSHPVICHFLNSLLATVQIESFPGASTSQLSSLNFLKTIVHASVEADFHHIFKFFDGLKLFDEFMKKLFPIGIVSVAITKSSLELLKAVLSHFERHHEFTRDMKSEALCFAVERFSISIVEYLLKEKQLRGIVEEATGQVGKLRMLLHDCVLNSTDNSETVITEKLIILRMLVGINPTLLEIQDEAGRTPLLYGRVHIQLLIELIRLGANVLARDGNMDTVIHWNDEIAHLSGEEFHSLLLNIPVERLEEMAHMKGWDDEAPLIKLLRRMNPLPVTLDLFKKVGANFNDVRPSLTVAVMYGRNMGTIRKLIKLGADVELREGGKTLLHLAAEQGNLEAVEVLIDEFGFDVNVKDEGGRTPLDHAIVGYDLGLANMEKRFETGLALHERSGIFEEYVHDDGASMLHVAAEEGDYQSVRLLVHLGMGVNGLDEKGNTPLHLAVKWDWLWERNPENFHQTVNFLLDSGAYSNKQNGNGETPFQMALANPNLPPETFQLLKPKTDGEWTPSLTNLILKFAIRKYNNFDDDDEFPDIARECEAHGVNWDRIDEEGNSALHVAVTTPNAKAMRYFVGKGVDINPKNTLGRTPLHESASIKETNFSFRVLKYLIENGADPLMMTNLGESLLHFSAGFLSAEALEFVLDLEEVKKGLDVNGRDVDGNTPLHWIILHHKNNGHEEEEECQCEAVGKSKLLIESGADISILNNEGFSPLVIAMGKYNNEDKEELIRLLRTSSKYFGMVNSFRKML